MCKTIFVESQDPVKIQQTLGAKSCKIRHIWEGKRNSLTSTASYLFQGCMRPGDRGQRRERERKSVCVCVCVCVCVYSLVFPSCIGCCQTVPFLSVPSRVLICELHEDSDGWGVEGISAWKNSSQSSGMHLRIQTLLTTSQILSEHPHKSHWGTLSADSLSWFLKSENVVTKLCPNLCDPMDCSPPGSSVHRGL